MPIMTKPIKQRGKLRDELPTLKRLLKTIFSNHRGMLVVSFIAILYHSFILMAESLFLRYLVNRYIVPLMHMRHPNFTNLAIVLVIMAVMYLLDVIAVALYTQLMVIVAQKTQLQLREQMFAHMQKLPLSFFDQNDYGNVMSRYTNDVDTLMQMISQSLPALVVAVSDIIFVLIGMITISWELTIISLLILSFSIIYVRFLSSKSTYYFNQQQQKLGQIDSYAEEMLHGQKVVKVFSYEDTAKRHFTKYNNNLAHVSGRANALSMMLFPFIGNLGTILYVLIALIGGFMLIKHVTFLSLGGIVAFLELSMSFIQPIAQISQQLNAIILALAGGHRIFSLLDEPVEIDQGTTTLVNVTQDADGTIHETNDHNHHQWAWKTPTPQGYHYTLLRGEIIFKHVDFSYSNNVDDLQLHDINLVAHPGQKVAFVGATGAGKTTITNMLNRFYEINSGEITYDGINIKDIAKDSLRRSLGMVLQQTNLFTGTISENIRYGRIDATDEEVRAAAKLADADEFIRQLPQGYNTVIKDSGSELSQGQRQLLSIARAAVADPPVMILDEATSSIDTQTECQVQAAMDRLMVGRTSFAIAHRLSTIYNADLIIVVDNGHIVESGNHKQLMQHHGEYYQLYTGSLTLE